jgi:hypothetical protein
VAVDDGLAEDFRKNAVFFAQKRRDIAGVFGRMIIVEDYRRRRDPDMDGDNDENMVRMTIRSQSETILLMY